MKHLFLTSVLCTTALLGGCTDLEKIESSYVLSETSKSLIYEVSEDTISKDGPEEFVIPEYMKKLKKTYIQLRSIRKKSHTLIDESLYDNTFLSNIYAIRELPSTIKVREKATSGSTNGYVNLYCDGRGKEVILNNTNHMKKNRFYIKVFPSSTGIPYLIYSAYSGTPLSVGHYTNKPNDKILMASKKEDLSSTNIGWDFLQTNKNKNYYSIQSMSYLGQLDPNDPWSISHYVLEAVSGNKIRYAQRSTNKAQQEFVITPDAKFNIISLEYDVVSPSVSKSTFSKTMTVKNTSSQEKNIDIPFDFYESENSLFDKSSWNINLNFSNTQINFSRPSAINGGVISPEENTPKDALFFHNGYQNINKHIVYAHPIRCRASSIAKVTLNFTRYNIRLSYTVKAQCMINGSIRECTLKGIWSGSIIEDPKEVQPEATIIYTPIGTGGDIAL